jgi:WD40 repeat protein
VAFAPGGRILATASRDGTVKLWNPLLDTDRHCTLARAEEVRSIAYSPDSRSLTAVGGQGTVWTLEAPSGRLLSTRQFQLSGGIECAEISRDATTVALLGRERTCQVWEIKTGRRILSIENATTVGRVRLSPDGKWLAGPVGPGDQCRIRVWNTETGREALVGNPGQITVWAFSPDRRTLAITYSSSGTPDLVDLVSGRIRSANVQGHVGRGIQALEFSADGRTVATGGGDRSIRLWDVGTLEERLMLKGRKGTANALSFSSDGKTLASFDTGRAMILWDIATGEQHLALEPIFFSLTGVRFSPDGSSLATSEITVPGRSIVSLWPAPREK